MGKWKTGKIGSGFDIMLEIILCFIILFSLTTTAGIGIIFKNGIVAGIGLVGLYLYGMKMGKESND